MKLFNFLILQEKESLRHCLLLWLTLLGMNIVQLYAALLLHIRYFVRSCLRHIIHEGYTLYFAFEIKTKLRFYTNEINVFIDSVVEELMEKENEYATIYTTEIL